MFSKTVSSSTLTNLKLYCFPQPNGPELHLWLLIRSMWQAVPLSNSVKILGVTLDQHLTISDHVQNVCKSSNYNTRALRHIRSYLTKDMARTVACALVNTRFDYCNSVLYHTTESILPSYRERKMHLSCCD